MASSVFVYDPTASDELSKVRGVGRYLQILRECFPDWNYVKDLASIPHNSVFINPFFNFLTPTFVKKRVARKQIALLHDLIPLKYPRHFPAGIKGKFFIHQNKKRLVQYDLVVTDSHKSKADIIKILGISETRVKVIYPTLPKIFNSKFPASSRLRGASKIPNSKYCIYVGDATWNKNLVNMAKAVELANVHCVVVGRVFMSHPAFLDHPWQKELKSFLQIAANDTRFIFPGFVSDRELVLLYRHAICNLLVSYDEGFGFSYLEAASQNTPSVLSSTDVLREVAEDTALFADPQNPQSIAERISQFFEDEDVRHTLGSDAKERTDFFGKKEFMKQFSSNL